MKEYFTYLLPHLIWLIPVFLLWLTYPSIFKKIPIPWVWIKIVLVVVIMVLIYKGCSNTPKEKAEKAKQVAEQAVAKKAAMPSTKLITFNEGTITSFTYYGGLLVWDAQGGIVDFIDKTGQHWEHTPGKMEIGIKNRQLHPGTIVVSKRADSPATGVKITQVWKD